MSLVQNKEAIAILPDTAEFTEKNKQSWAPSATQTVLRERSKFLNTIRQFFETRGVLEVETPLMCATGATDPHIQTIPATYTEGNLTQAFYLQTSPEFAMKRLLASGSGPIYQMCKAFRNGERGTLHNPEFTILEWYRPGFDHHQLMDEMSEFLSTILGCPPAIRTTYQALFEQFFQINPHGVSLSELRKLAGDQNIQVAVDVASTLNSDDWLNLLFTHIIEPTLGFEAPSFILDYPKSQAALAKIRPGTPPVAERFEVYIKGIELANGYHELQDPDNQLSRFEADNLMREALFHSPMPIDYRLIEALRHGLPACAGVALGIDRLFMIKLNLKKIEEALAFSFNRA